MLRRCLRFQNVEVFEIVEVCIIRSVYVYQFKPNRLTGLRMENIPVNFLQIKRQMSNLIVDLSASIFETYEKKKHQNQLCLQSFGTLWFCHNKLCFAQKHFVPPLTPAKPQYRWKCGAFSSSEAQKQLSYGDGPPGLHFQDQVKKWGRIFSNLNSFCKF